MKKLPLRRAMRLEDGSTIYWKTLLRVAQRSELVLQDPTVRTLVGQIRAKQWSNVISTVESLEIQQYSGILDQYVKTQLVALVKKYPFTTDELPGFDPEATAWKKFQSAEHRCRRINQRSALLRNGVGFPYGDILSSAQGYIRSVLGEVPNMEKIYDLCDFGPGASVRVSGDLTNFGRKFLAKKWTVTRLALSYATSALYFNEQIRNLVMRDLSLTDRSREKFSDLVRARVELVTHNNINFVPKTFKTFRSIASEPLLNGFLQKGIDLYLRQRLAGAGLDLRDQASNQRMAREGSLGGFNSYSTLDLSSASDSISDSVVKTLLPSDWYDLLQSCRAHQYKFKGKIYSYHKFVSMGNGFCFPLQTLIFASICHAVCMANNAPVDFRVYGDDIIVRQSEALSVIEVLRYLGFRTNPDKTNIFGPFRESCGADWYSGQDIRPAYLDFRFSDVRDLYKFHNAALRSTFTASLVYDEVAEDLREACPPRFRFVRPYHGNADGAFTVPLDVAMHSPFVRWSKKSWSWHWKEVNSSSVPDLLDIGDPLLCNEVKYVAWLRARGTRRSGTLDTRPKAEQLELTTMESITDNPEPLAIRRKSKVSICDKAYWGIPGHVTWHAPEWSAP
jgi:hypothetical protein